MNPGQSGGEAVEASAPLDLLLTQAALGPVRIQAAAQSEFHGDRTLHLLRGIGRWAPRRW